MEMILDGGKTVVCPECFAHLHLDEPAVAGQEIQCHQCRVIVVIAEVSGKLVPEVKADEAAEEDTTW